jgi:hypothetical protein
MVLRKRKSKSPASSSYLTPDLNLPVADEMSPVPQGLVMARVSQLVKHRGEGENTASMELAKKQKKNTNNNDAQSAAAASVSPRRAP